AGRPRRVGGGQGGGGWQQRGDGFGRGRRHPAWAHGGRVEHPIQDRGELQSGGEAGRPRRVGGGQGGGGWQQGGDGFGRGRGHPALAGRRTFAARGFGNRGGFAGAVAAVDGERPGGASPDGIAAAGRLPRGQSDIRRSMHGGESK